MTKGIMKLTPVITARWMRRIQLKRPAGRAVPMPVGGAVAFAFIGLIDVVVGRFSRRWATKRPGRGGRTRIELVEQDPS